MAIAQWRVCSFSIIFSLLSFGFLIHADYLYFRHWRKPPTVGGQHSTTLRKTPHRFKIQCSIFILQRIILAIAKERSPKLLQDFFIQFWLILKSPQPKNENAAGRSAPAASLIDNNFLYFYAAFQIINTF